MADLMNIECCTPAAQETCCEPSEKASCCSDSDASACGCSAGSGQTATITATATVDQVRETVRAKYASAATAAASGTPCCGPSGDGGVWGASLYTDSGESGAPDPRSRTCRSTTKPSTS